MNKKLIFLSIFFGLLLVLLVLNTSPTNSPLPLIVVPLILIGVVVGLVSSLVAHSLKAENKSWRVFLPVVLGILSTLLVVMTSLKQLSFTTGFLMAAFVALFVFYLSRAKR